MAKVDGKAITPWLNDRWLYRNSLGALDAVAFHREDMSSIFVGRGGRDLEVVKAGCVNEV